MNEFIDTKAYLRILVRTSEKVWRSGIVFISRLVTHRKSFINDLSWLRWTKIVIEELYLPIHSLFFTTLINDHNRCRRFLPVLVWIFHRGYDGTTVKLSSKKFSTKKELLWGLKEVGETPIQSSNLNSRTVFLIHLQNTSGKFFRWNSFVWVDLRPGVRDGVKKGKVRCWILHYPPRSRR